MTACIVCKYAEWRRTKNGRLHPSGDGRCGYPWKLPPLPAAMYFISDPKPSGGYIRRNDKNSTACPCRAEADTAPVVQGEA
jgi:hypothetical protein